MPLPTPSDASPPPDLRPDARLTGEKQGNPSGFGAPRSLRPWLTLGRGRGSASRSPFALLRRRLVVTNTVIVAIVLATLCAVFFAYEAHATQIQVDQQLATEATSEAAKGLPQLADHTDEDESPYQPGSPNLFSIIIAPAHRVVQDDDHVGRVGLPDWASADAVFRGASPSSVVTVERGGVSYRLYTVPIESGTRIVGAVQSGTALTVYHEQLLSLLRVLVLLSLCVLLLTVLLSLWLAERALAPARQAFARQRQFAAAASHELRTPLAFIRSQAELIADAPAAQVPATEVADDAREIVTEVDYLTRMTRDLLLLARDEHDARALALRSVNLREIAREAVAKVQPLAQEQDITLNAPGSEHTGAPATYESGTIPRVWGDADRLRQLVLILLDNALRYTPQGGRVDATVRVERKRRLGVHPEGAAVLTVRDTGVGIAPTELARIFEPFYRASAPQPHLRDEHSRTTTEGGTGLGLALAQWIVHAHGGEITVRSTPGAGSVFTVTLPLLTHRHAGTNNTEPSPFQRAR